jgi:S1-C subfamily serine protease
MSGLTTFLVSWAAFTPVVAPVPREPAPNPLARAAIGVSADQNSLLVTNVYPHMPAGKAGVRTGDRIVRVGRLVPTEFNQVVNHICSFRPGAVLEIEVDRGGERKVFRMKLAARPEEYDNPNRGPYPPLPVFPDER